MVQVDFFNIKYTICGKWTGIHAISNTSCLLQHHMLYPPYAIVWVLLAHQIVVHWKLGPQIDVTGPLRSGAQGEVFKLLRVLHSKGYSGSLG